MRIAELVFLYLCVGLCVAAAVRDRRRWLAIPLWPLVVPSLLAVPTERFDTAPAAPVPRSSPVEAALQRIRDALAVWDGAPQVPLAALERALGDLDGRRAALAALLQRPEYQDATRANVAALSRLHDELTAELTAAIARIDDVVTRIQVAHFSGGALGDLAEQLAAVIGAVEGARAARVEVDAAAHG